MSRAAEHAGTSQPAISVQVRALEDEFGVALFERRGPRISLTRDWSSCLTGRGAGEALEGVRREAVRQCLCDDSR